MISSHTKDSYRDYKGHNHIEVFDFMYDWVIIQWIMDAVSKQRSAVNFNLNAEITENDQNEQDADVDDEAGVEGKLSTESCSFCVHKVWDCEKILNCHFSKLGFVIHVIVFLFYHFWIELCHDKVVHRGK